MHLFIAELSVFVFGQIADTTTCIRPNTVNPLFGTAIVDNVPHSSIYGLEHAHI